MGEGNNNELNSPSSWRMDLSHRWERVPRIPWFRKNPGSPLAFLSTGLSAGGIVDVQALMRWEQKGSDGEGSDGWIVNKLHWAWVG